MHQLSDLPAWASELLEAQPVAHLGLLDERGHPRVQPVTFARVGETLVTAVDAKPKKPGTPARIARLRQDPRATITVDRYDDDWTRLAWVQVLATANVTDIHPAALAALQARYPAYATPPPGPLIELTPIRILCWRASG